MPLSSCAKNWLRERFAEEKAIYDGRKSDKTKENDLARYEKKFAFHAEELRKAQSEPRTGGAPRRAIGSFRSNHLVMKLLFRKLIAYVKPAAAEPAQPLAAAQPAAAEPATLP